MVFHDPCLKWRTGIIIFQPTITLANLELWNYLTVSLSWNINNVHHHCQKYPWDKDCIAKSLSAYVWRWTIHVRTSFWLFGYSSDTWKTLFMIWISSTFTFTSTVSQSMRSITNNDKKYISAMEGTMMCYKGLCTRITFSIVFQKLISCHCPDHFMSAILR